MRNKNIHYEIPSFIQIDGKSIIGSIIQVENTNKEKPLFIVIYESDESYKIAGCYMNICSVNKTNILTPTIVLNIGTGDMSTVRMLNLDNFIEEIHTFVNR